MQGPQGGEGPPGLDVYEQMVDTFAKNAKGFWQAWGPMGEPMARGVDAWAEMQRQYVQWLRQASGENQR
jgi:hypothetical protein